MTPRESEALERIEAGLRSLAKQVKPPLFVVEMSKELVLDIAGQLADVRRALAHREPRGEPPTADAIMDGGVTWPDEERYCPNCKGDRWVCEIHRSEVQGHAGCGGAGEPCPACNPAATGFSHLLHERDRIRAAVARFRAAIVAAPSGDRNGDVWQKWYAGVWDIMDDTSQMVSSEDHARAALADREGEDG